MATLVSPCQTPNPPGNQMDSLSKIHPDSSPAPLHCCLPGPHSWASTWVTLAPAPSSVPQGSHASALCPRGLLIYARTSPPAPSHTHSLPPHALLPHRCSPGMPVGVLAQAVEKGCVSGLAASRVPGLRALCSRTKPNPMRQPAQDETTQEGKRRLGRRSGVWTLPPL